MFRDKKRFGQNPETVVRSSDATFNKPLSWKEPAKVFVCSWSDFFIEEADGWRDDAWEIIRKCPHLTFLLLTKRPLNFIGGLPADGIPDNVWFGVTAENQEQWDERVKVLQLFGKAKTFVSVEPMLGYVYMRPSQRYYIDWVICGGESGPNARPMTHNWAESLKRQCLVLEIPFFMKQMSGKTKRERGDIPEQLLLREFPKR
jgi:protein gp37